MRAISEMDEAGLAEDGRVVIRGFDLRYVLTTMLMVDGGVLTVAELAAGLRAKGFATGGRSGKVISDCLRSEVGWGRVSGSVVEDIVPARCHGRRGGGSRAGPECWNRWRPGQIPQRVPTSDRLPRPERWRGCWRPERRRRCRRAGCDRPGAVVFGGWPVGIGRRPAAGPPPVKAGRIFGVDGRPPGAGHREGRR